LTSLAFSDILWLSGGDNHARKRPESRPIS